MTDNTLAVKVTADVADLQSKFAIAQAQVRGLTSEMNSLAKAAAAGQLSIVPAAYQQMATDLLAAKQQAAGFSEQLAKAGFNAANFGTRMKSESEGVGGAFEAMSGKVNAALQFTGVGLAIEAVHKLMEAVSEASQSANEIRSMSEVLGVTTTQFQAMQIAAEEAGIGAEQMFRAEEKLVTILNEARDGSGAAIEKLKGIGITNDQIRDTSFGAAQMMAYLSGRLNDSQTATGTMAAMTKELGARAAIAAEGIKQLGSNVDDWNKKAAEANSLNEAQLGRLHEIGAWWGIVGREIHNATSAAIVWSADHSGLLKDAAQLIPQLGAMANAFDLLGTSESKAGHASGSIDRSGAVAAQTATQNAALAAAQVGNTAITKDTLDSVRDQIEATKQGSAQRLALVREFYTDSLAFYANDPSVDKVKEAHRQLVAEERQYGEELKRQAEKNAADLVSETREKASAIMAEEGVTKAQQLAQVRDLYAQELLNATLTKDKRVEVERSLNESITAINREASSTRQAIARSDADTDIAIAKLTIDAKRTELEQEVQANQVSAARKLAVLRELTAQEFVLNQTALEGELKALNQGTAEYERVYNQIRELKAKLTVDLVNLDRQYQQDLARQLKEQSSLWKGMVGEVESVEGTLVSDIVSRRKTMSQSLIAIGSDLITKEIANDLKAFTTKELLDNQTKALEQGGYLYHLLFSTKSVASDQAAEAAKTSAATAGAAARTAAAATAATATQAESAATGPPQVLADAAKAAAGAYQAIVGIPYIGPALAPGAAAEAFAAVSAYAPLASLDAGTNYVPRDMLAQLHQGESVQPKAYNPAAGGTGGSQGVGATHNYGDIHMTDTNMKRLLSGRAGQRMIFDGLSAAYRRGAR